MPLLLILLIIDTVLASSKEGFQPVVLYPVGSRPPLTPPKARPNVFSSIHSSSSNDGQSSEFKIRFPDAPKYRNPHLIASSSRGKFLYLNFDLLRGINLILLILTQIASRSDSLSPVPILNADPKLINRNRKKNAFTSPPPPYEEHRRNGPQTLNVLETPKKGAENIDGEMPPQLSLEPPLPLTPKASHRSHISDSPPNLLSPSPGSSINTRDAHPSNTPMADVPRGITFIFFLSCFQFAEL